MRERIGRAKSGGCRMSRCKAVVQGSIAVFGTYSEDGTDNIITFHIEGSTFPNWNGTVQK
jgi:hypothetical protein